MSLSINTTTLSSQEAELYDRQIRLFGIQAQERLQRSKILLIGFNNVQAEVCKNVALAGLNDITIVDWVIVGSQDTTPHLFLDPENSVGYNRAVICKEQVAELNPLLKITAVAVNSPDQAIEYLQQALSGVESSSFDIVVASGLDFSHLYQINLLCRQSSPPTRRRLCTNEPNLNQTVPFIALQCFGMRSFIFLDLGQHTYTEETMEGIKTVHLEYVDLKTSLDVSNVNSKVSDIYWAIRCIYNLEQANNEFSSDQEQVNIETKIKAMLSKCNNNSPRASVVAKICNGMIEFKDYELSPVCAIIGGLAGQEIIKTVVASYPPPFNNYCFFDAETMENQVVKIGYQNE